MTVEEIIKLLDLRPHPEGGFYRETYRSLDTITIEQLPDRYSIHRGPPTGRTAFRESLEWQVQPDLEKRAQEARSGSTVTQEQSESPAAGDHTETTRPWCTSIYYLLTPDSYSHMHRLHGDEIYHFYLGDPVEMLTLHGNGRWQTATLGNDIVSGAVLQYVVPHDVWQGSRLIDGGKFALLGTTMSPGFSFSDYEHGDRNRLVDQYPNCKQLIEKLTT